MMLTGNNRNIGTTKKNCRNYPRNRTVSVSNVGMPLKGRMSRIVDPDQTAIFFLKEQSDLSLLCLLKHSCPNTENSS